MRTQRGFTLVELLTGVAVSSIILIAVASAVIGISGAYSNESQTRSAVEGGRTALAFIERNLKLAGYGIDPRFAFVMDDPPGMTTAKDNYEVQANPRITTDDLAFRYRDPTYVRRGAAGATISSFTFESGVTVGKEFPAGSAFIIACPPGGTQRAWFRSTATVTASDTAIPLEPYGTAYNAPAATPLDCVGLAGADAAPYLFHLREFRFRVFVDSRGRGFLGYIPNIATDLSSGAWPDDGRGQLLAADVEEFQVAYQMNRPPPTSSTTPVDNGGNKNWVLMDAAGESLPSQSSPAPTLDDDYSMANRFNDHPANIRAVRVNFSVRSARLRTGKATGFPRGRMENGPDGGGEGDGYFRAWMTSAVRCANMTSRAFFLPPLISAGTTGGNDDGA